MRTLPRWILLPAGLGALFVILPLAAMALRVEWSDFWGLITSESSLAALRLTWGHGEDLDDLHDEFRPFRERFGVPIENRG